MNDISNLCTVVIPTFFPGDEIFENLKSIPAIYKILVVDNSYNNSLANKISNYKNCDYYNIGDVGLGKTFNFAVSKIETPYILLTQPDVILGKNCIQNLIEGFEKYKNVGMAVPIVYDSSGYSKYDFYDLKYSKKKKEFLYKKYTDIKSAPLGDFCVDAVNATTMLINLEAIKEINGWDNNYYVYLEDIDICLRLKLNNYSIIKVANAKVDHLGWSSHFKEIKDSMNTSRIWHFTWSSLYFESKFCRKSIIIKKLLKIISFSIFKLILNMIILRFRKVNQNLIKLSACFAFVLKRGSYFRVKHKVDKN